MSTGTRFYAHTGNDDIKLQYQFTRMGEPFIAYKFKQVEIYDNYDDAISRTNPIQIILEDDIVNEYDPLTEADKGLYSYTINTPVAPGTYFDVQIIQPRDTLLDMVDIEAFYVGDEQFSGSPGDLPLLCYISGYIINTQKQPIEGAIISARLIRNIIGEDQYSVIGEVVYTKTNEIGFWHMELVRSSVNNTNVAYEFNIREGSIREKYLKIIPNLNGVSFNELEDVLS